MLSLRGAVENWLRETKLSCRVGSYFYAAFTFFKSPCWYSLSVSISICHVENKCDWWVKTFLTPERYYTLYMDCECVKMFLFSLFSGGMSAAWFSFNSTVAILDVIMKTIHYIWQTHPSSVSCMKIWVTIVALGMMLMCCSLSTRTLLLLQFASIHDVEIEDGWRMKIDLIWFLFSFFHFVFSVYLRA